MNDELKKMLDDSYENNDLNSNNNFVDPNDLKKIAPSNVTAENLNSSYNEINSNLKNDNATVSNVIENKNENKKKIISLPIFIFIIVGIFLILFILFFDFKDNKKKNEIPNVNSSSNSDNKTDNIVNKQESDIYGYTFLSYIPDDDSWKEYYRIVELHKNSADKILASYNTDIKNSINQIRNINVNSAKIINNKIYYQLYYNSSNNGIMTYNNIMCIDLDSEDKIPYEVFNWKQDEANYKKSIKSFKVTYDYIYFSTIDSTLFYKYSFDSKEVEESSEEEFNKIKEKIDSNYTRLNNPRNYYRGAEAYIEDNNKLIYDGKTIYSGTNSVLTIYYSFSGKLIFSEGTDCENISCDTIKYYNYDFTSNGKQEIDFNTNQIFSQIVWLNKKTK